MAPKAHKLYCFVDETGQDTLGKLFVVVAVMVDDDRDRLRTFLRQLEKSSGIGKRKWMRAKTDMLSRNSLSEGANPDNFRNKIYYRSYSNTGRGAYEDLTVSAVAITIHTYRERHNIEK